MPQMNPMSWTILFIYFIYLFYLFILFIYFNKLYTNMNSLNNNMFKTLNMNWSW